MFNKAKYIVIKYNLPYGGTKEKALVFDEDMLHAHVAGLFPEDVVVSAGFCSVDGEEAQVWGRSDSTGLSSRPEDAKLVGRATAQSSCVDYFYAGD